MTSRTMPAITTIPARLHPHSKRRLHESGLPSALHRHVQPRRHDCCCRAGQRWTTHADSWQPTNLQTPSLQSRTFVIDELEGFRVEFHLAPDGGVDELIFHQPNGTFVARRAIMASR